MNGPYDTEQQTLVEQMPEAVRALHDTGQVRTGDPDRLVSGTVLAHLVGACTAAGVELGDYDQRILRHMARFGETSTAQVVIGLIARAYAAGVAEGGTR